MKTKILILPPKMRNILLVLGVFYMFLGVSFSHATTHTIISDGSWKSYNQVQTGWNLLDYNDSSWRYATEFYGNNFEYKFWGIAIPIWDWPGQGTSTGMNGPVMAYFRKNINLDGPVTSAFVTFAADDSAAIYVNGTLIRHASSGTNISIPADLFHMGNNILAVYANDGQVGYVYDRTLEIVGFYFNIETASWLSIAGFSGSETIINPLPLAGQKIALAVAVTGNSNPAELDWTLSANGQVVAEGVGVADGIAWDGRNGEGKIEPGTYDLLLSLRNTNGGGTAEQSLTAVLELTDDCMLRATFPSPGLN